MIAPPPVVAAAYAPIGVGRHSASLPVAANVTATGEIRSLQQGAKGNGRVTRTSEENGWRFLRASTMRKPADHATHRSRAMTMARAAMFARAIAAALPLGVGDFPNVLIAGRGGRRCDAARLAPKIANVPNAQRHPCQRTGRIKRRACACALAWHHAPPPRMRRIVTPRSCRRQRVPGLPRRPAVRSPHSPPHATRPAHRAAAPRRRSDAGAGAWPAPPPTLRSDRRSR